MLTKVVETFATVCHKAYTAFWAAPLATKVFMIVVPVPWIPIFLGLGYMFAPPEVMELVLANGETVKSIVGNHYSLASYHFVQWVGSIFS